LEQFGRGPQRFAEFNRIGAVQPARTVIPTLQGGVTQGCFGKAHPFSFSSTDPPNEIVANNSGFRMGYAKYSHDDISQEVRVLLGLQANRQRSWSSGMGCKREGVPD
jgi:hypothetical protein